METKILINGKKILNTLRSQYLRKIANQINEDKIAKLFVEMLWKTKESR